MSVLEPLRALLGVFGSLLCIVGGIVSIGTAISGRVAGMPPGALWAVGFYFIGRGIAGISEAARGVSVRSLS